ncbi:hypothetical protein Tco_0565717 [Tanacetum coccineum]
MVDRWSATVDRYWHRRVLTGWFRGALHPSFATLTTAVNTVDRWVGVVRCTVAVRGGRTRQYEVLFRWRLDQSERDTWHWRVSVRGVRVSVRGQACMDPCQSLAIMRRLVECKKSIIPLDPAISLDEDLKGRNCPSHLEAINGARISCI